MQRRAIDSTSCQMWFMLFFYLITAAATGAFSITTCACLEASAALHYTVFQKSHASDQMTKTHALHTKTGNVATIHKHASKFSPRSKIAGIVIMRTRPAVSTYTHLCCCGQCKLWPVASGGSCHDC